MSKLKKNKDIVQIIIIESSFDWPLQNQPSHLLSLLFSCRHVVNIDTDGKNHIFLAI